MRYWVARAPSPVHWPLTVGQGSDGPICKKGGLDAVQVPILFPDLGSHLCLPREGELGLPAALVLVPGIQAVWVSLASTAITAL